MDPRRRGFPARDPRLEARDERGAEVSRVDWQYEMERAAAHEMGKRHATAIVAWRVVRSLAIPLLVVALIVAVASVAATATREQLTAVALYGSLLAVGANVAFAFVAWSRAWYLSPASRVASIGLLSVAGLIVASLLVWLAS
jgi:hypothetical protein